MESNGDRESTERLVHRMCQVAETKDECVAIIERYSPGLGYRFIVRALRGWDLDRCRGKRG